MHGDTEPERGLKIWLQPGFKGSALMQVYAEGYAAVNFALNAALLVCCGSVCGVFPKKGRVALSSLLGCAYAFLCFAPGLGFLQVLPVKAAYPLFLVRVAFGRRPIMQTARLWAAFFIATFIFGGTGFGLVYMLGAGGFGVGSALLAGLIGAVAVRFLLAQKKARRIEEGIIELTLERGGKTCQIQGFVDTGNLLCDPVSAIPVIICKNRGIMPLLERTGGFVCFEAAGGGGFAELYRPDAVYAVIGGERMRLCDAFIAFCDMPGHRGGFDALVPETVFKDIT